MAIAFGCCALLRMGDGEYEVAKIAVSREHQGKGIGRLLLSAAVVEAQQLGANRLYLETNKILKPAIARYESMGFQHIDPSRVVPSPYARADVYMELLFEDHA
jgi:GNAT superfamily N-acetyltransferase